MATECTVGLKSTFFFIDFSSNKILVIYEIIRKIPRTINRIIGRVSHFYLKMKVDVFLGFFFLIKRLLSLIMSRLYL